MFIGIPASHQLNANRQPVVIETVRQCECRMSGVERIHEGGPSCPRESCATGISEPRIVTVCPPMVAYSREFQTHAAEELELLPEGSAIAEMLADYAVMRGQIRACQHRR